MLIVDAQIHLWSKGTTLPPHRAEPYLLDEALRDMDAAGVDRALIHPPSWDADSNELAVAAVRAHPDRFAILLARATREPAARSRVEEPARQVTSNQLSVVSDQKVPSGHWSLVTDH